jgi:CDP-diacylglycerol--glycerol-3-phosphate 3-phosphatidyltransferase
MGESGAGRAGLTTAGWSELHHGIDPDQVPLLRAWLRFVWTVARPFKTIPPLIITAAGAASAVVAVIVTPAGALVLVVASVLCDALDGAVALAAGRVSRLGSVADKTADRIADSAFALVVWQCGAPLWLALSAGASTLIVEGVRVVRGGVALARITVAERPTRTICTVLACGSAAVSMSVWPPTVCAAVWTVLGLIGIVQVATA